MMIGLVAAILRIDSPATAAGKDVEAGSYDIGVLPEFGSHLEVADFDGAADGVAAGAAPAAGIPVAVSLPVNDGLAPAGFDQERREAPGTIPSIVIATDEYARALVKSAEFLSNAVPSEQGGEGRAHVPPAPVTASAFVQPMQMSLAGTAPNVEQRAKDAFAHEPLGLETDAVVTISSSAHHRPVVRPFAEVWDSSFEPVKTLEKAVEGQQGIETDARPVPAASSAASSVLSAGVQQADVLESPPDLVQQMTSALSTILNEPVAKVDSTPARGQPLPTPSPLRVLNLVLRPQELGQVSIRMKLSGQGLTVEVIAEKASTHRLLESEAHKLADHLVSGGYDLDQLSIQQQTLSVAAAPKEAAMVSKAGETQSALQSGVNSGANQQDGHGRRNETERSAPPPSPGAPEKAAVTDEPSITGRKGIYL